MLSILVDRASSAYKPLGWFVRKYIQMSHIDQKALHLM